MITCCLKYIKMELGYFYNKNSQSLLTPYRLLNMRATNSAMHYGNDTRWQTRDNLDS